MVHLVALVDLFKACLFSSLRSKGGLGQREGHGGTSVTFRTVMRWNSFACNSDGGALSHAHTRASRNSVLNLEDYMFGLYQERRNGHLL